MEARSRVPQSGLSNILERSRDREGHLPGTTGRLFQAETGYCHREMQQRLCSQPQLAEEDSSCLGVSVEV